MQKFFLPILLCSLLLVGCRTNQQYSEYPIGIYAAGNVTNYSTIRLAGFSHIMASASSETLNAARDAGLKVVATPGQQARGDLNKDRIWKIVRVADKHPALASWYLIDEPDYTKTDPASVVELARYLKAKGVRKPTSMVIFKGYEAHNYAGISDILMLDRYPIGWQPIETFGKHIRLAKHAAGDKQPLWAVIQAFDWSYYPTVWESPADNPEGGARPPTEEELRNMAWTALGLGCEGIFFYPYADSKWKMVEHTETWEACTRVVEEVRAFEPLFHAKQIWFPQKIEYLEAKQGFNAVYEPTILCAKLRVDQSNDLLPCGDYILCVNTVREKVPFTLDLGNATVQSCQCLDPALLGHSDEKVVLPTPEGKVWDELAPLAVKVYHISAELTE